MWPVAKFLGTVFISFIAMIGALGAENPFPLFAVAWGIWIIYILSLRAKRKKQSEPKLTNVKPILERKGLFQSIIPILQFFNYLIGDLS